MGKVAAGPPARPEQQYVRGSTRIEDGETDVVLARIRARQDPGQLLAHRLRKVAGRPGRVPYIDDRGIGLAEVELAPAAAPGRHGCVRLREDDPRAAPYDQVIAATGEGLLQSEIRAIRRKPEEGIVLARVAAAPRHRAEGHQLPITRAAPEGQ